MPAVFRTLILASLSSVLNFTTLSTQAEPVTSNLTSLQAQAEKKAYADQATLNLVITTEKAKFTDSVKHNTNLLKRFNRSLVSKKISKENIRQTTFPTTEETSKQASTGVYQVKSRLSVTVGNEKQLKAVTLLVDKNKEVEFVNTEFSHSQQDELNNEVRKLAIDKIMKQKAVYEKNLGVELVTKGIRDNYIGSEASKGAKAMSTKQPTSFDELEYRADITVNFAVK